MVVVVVTVAVAEAAGCVCVCVLKIERGTEDRAGRARSQGGSEVQEGIQFSQNCYLKMLFYRCIFLSYKQQSQAAMALWAQFSVFCSVPLIHVSMC